MAVYIECKQCGHRESIDKRWFLKVIGGAVAGFGPVAWIAFLFAGTGFALPICAAILAGGVAMMAYADQIAGWIDSRYPCPGCRAKSWRLIHE